MTERAMPELISPDHTAVRVALWRALHLQLDLEPHVLQDALGLQLAAPADGWRERPDMHPIGTRRSRASIVGRARFIEDHVAEQAARGVQQYVILGAGLDTFAQRQPQLSARLRVFEVDRPGPQVWKRKRLSELGLRSPESLRFVPVDFEARDAWWQQLTAAGFDPRQPAIVASTGVSLYLTHEANLATLRQLAQLAAGSSFVMTFMLPVALIEPEEHIDRQHAERGARAAGTPFISFYTPDELLGHARSAGFREARHVSAGDLEQRYFAGRPDGLRPSSSEALVVAHP